MLLAMGTMELCLMTPVACRLVQWLAISVKYSVYPDYLGDPTVGRGVLNGILSVLNTPEAQTDLPDNLTVNAVVFGLNPGDPCLWEGMIIPTNTYVDAALNGQKLARLRKMVTRDRATVQRIDIPILDEDMKLALCLYTAEVPIPLYQHIGDPFKIQKGDERPTIERTRNSLWDDENSYRFHSVVVPRSAVPLSKNNVQGRSVPRS
jgi:hypothetical protein